MVGCLGSEPRLAQSQTATFSGAWVKPSRLGGGECGPCPDFSSYTLAFALQLRKITANLSQGSRKALGWSEHDSLSRLGHRGRWPRLACCLLPPLAFASGDGVTTFNPRLTNLTVLLPQSRDCSCYVSGRILAPPPL